MTLATRETLHRAQHLSAHRFVLRHFRVLVKTASLVPVAGAILQWHDLYFHYINLCYFKLMCSSKTDLMPVNFQTGSAIVELGLTLHFAAIDCIVGIASSVGSAKMRAVA